VRRQLRPADRLVEDLHVDSLNAIEMMVQVEDVLGIGLIDDPRTASVSTVEHFVRLVDELAAERAVR
jgi:acyl carrier protein